uniref:Uncharacterized protein n=1 Tax=Arundo donax TaxID=35708 RepID=A0A0A9A5A0_ARUDO
MVSVSQRPALPLNKNSIDAGQTY